MAAQLRHGELDPSLISLMESFADSAVQQVSRALQFYSASGSQEQLSTLYITGGLASLPGIKDKLSSELGIRVHGLDPFERVEIASQINMDRLNAEKNALTKALSLALRGVGGQYENH
ncbi:Competence protein A [Marinobacterium sp. xm-d-530]|nr:Competence protein A [Marinobacterium sp. xm-d-530]